VPYHVQPEALAERHADKVRLLWDDFNKARTSRAVAGQNDRGAGATTARASATSSGADGVAVLPVATAATAAVGPRVSAEPRASAAAKQTPTEAIAVARGSGSDRAVVQHKVDWLGSALPWRVSNLVLRVCQSLLILLTGGHMLVGALQW